ncbi:hypothetical protein [Cryptosporangium aurantiacum]|uniref:Uncharacterized protein n=1 Tax=Cryptosporangium aurantiacum TaxID=134849 RepID=A0A1M7RJY2_9ACTN|nr:hypothetical protein [Cryptosporangium aurantiacum]SHN46617.1 hypothetical protein SAMN05443668_116153 [Cryptosporangium aurantiacum]
MVEGAEAGEQAHELSRWSVEELEVYVAVHRGAVLETVREVAQSQAYRSDLPRNHRRRWAALALLANDRQRSDDAWGQTRKISQDLHLRTWVAEHLGPDADPAVKPTEIAADTLAALTLEPSDALTMSINWRELPVEQIGLLRRHKNLTAHLSRLIELLPSGPEKDQLAVWIAVRGHLP